MSLKEAGKTQPSERGTTAERTTPARLRAVLSPTLARYGSLPLVTINLALAEKVPLGSQPARVTLMTYTRREREGGT